MSWLRSIVFTAFVIFSIPFYATLVLLGAPFGRKAAYRGVIEWTRLVMWSCRFFCKLDFVVEGREYIPTEPSVVFLKHSSAWETLSEALVFPQQTWVLKRELMWVPFFGWALHALKPIAINRRAGRSAVEQVVEQGKRRLHDDKLWVMIFPEGTRMPPGQTKRYGRSGALLAREAGVKIVPVAHNAADFWPAAHPKAF